MSFLFGSRGSNAQSKPQYTGLDIQTSSQGLVIPIIFGQRRAAPNMIWWGNFRHQSHDTDTGGKGGAPDSGGKYYTYSAGIALALCEGPLIAIVGGWKGKDRFVSENRTVTETFSGFSGTTVTVSNAATYISNGSVHYPGSIIPGAALTKITSGTPTAGQYKVNTTTGVYTFNATEVSNGDLWGVKITYTYHYESVPFTIYTGTISQNADPWLLGFAPTEALPYRRTAYIINSAWDLGSSASLPNLSLEIQGFMYNASAPGAPDVNPADIVEKFLTNARYGAGFPIANLSSLDNYRTYCQAVGFFMSPKFDEQKPAAEHLMEIVASTNCGFQWSGNVLDIIPFEGNSINRNGTTWTPPATAQYDITDDDYEEPPKLIRKRQTDTYNSIRVQYLDRSHDYNISIAPARNLADALVNGERKLDPIQCHWFCTKEAATYSANRMLLRQLIRNTYQFSLDWRFIGLDVMDIVTLTDAVLGLNKLWVRITEITENEDGDLQFIAEEYVAGSALTTEVSGLSSPGGAKMNFAGDAPETLTPAFIEPPAELCINPSMPELWVAMAGDDDWGGCDIWLSEDDATYKRIGTVTGSARMGQLTDQLDSHASPDNTNVLKVLLNSNEQLLSGTQADADNLRTLCYVDGELIAYRTASLQTVRTYWMTHLVRGVYGSTIGDHAALSVFVRLDDRMFKKAFTLADIGKTFYFKFVSFNPQMKGAQSLDQVTAYAYTITGQQNAMLMRSPDGTVYKYTAANGGTLGHTP